MEAHDFLIIFARLFQNCPNQLKTHRCVSTGLRAHAESTSASTHVLQMRVATYQGPFHFRAPRARPVRTMDTHVHADAHVHVHRTVSGTGNAHTGWARRSEQTANAQSVRINAFQKAALNASVCRQIFTHKGRPIQIAFEGGCEEL